MLMMPRCFRIIFAVLLCFQTLVPAGSPSPLHAEPLPFREYQVKAAFIYTIAKFVEWPTGGSGASGQSLTIGIVGQDSFGDNLDAIKGKTVKGRPIAVRHFRRNEDIRGCDVVFISISEKRSLSHILKQLQNAPVLTIADHEGFCETGGMINLLASGNRVVFEINMTAARRARLSISSQLLKLARTVIE